LIGCAIHGHELVGTNAAEVRHQDGVYLTLVETGVFVPLEIYELTKSISALKVRALVINIAVVSYLLISKRLFGVRGGATAELRQREMDSGWIALGRTAPAEGSA
jgi:hypothetical protein